MKTRQSLLALLLCALCLLSALPARAEWSDGYRYTIAAVIDAPSGKVHLRSKASAKSASKGLYFTGTQVMCAVSDNASWTRVRVGMETGYIKSEYLRVDSAMAGVISAQPTGTVKSKGGVNLREKPSKNASRLATLEKGSTMTVLGETKEHWYYVNTGSMLGYVMAEYVTLGKATGASAQNAGGQSTPPNVSAKEVETAMAAYAAALRNQRRLTYSPGGNILVSDFAQSGGRQGAIGDLSFALADVDADGMVEIALDLTRTEQNLAYGGEYAVLDYQDGSLYVYFCNLRAFNLLKMDGTFWFSSSAWESGFGRLSLNRGDSSIVTYAESAMDQNDVIRYFSYGRPITEAEFDSLCSAQDAKPDVAWFPLTEANISMVFGM